MSYKIDDTRKARLLAIYEILMGLLALVIVVILFIEFTRPITEEQAVLLARIDLSILIIFAIDYFYRLARAKNKWVFVKSNIFDLVAIMPFDKAFRLARVARLFRLARLLRTTRAVRILRLFRLIRLFAFANRFGNTFSGVIKTNGLVYVIIATATIVFMGACGILAFEENMSTFGDALWWSLVTTTTVGYGDISPETAGGRVIAGILMLIGIGFLGMVTGSVATYFVDRLSKRTDQEKMSFKNKQLNLIKDQLDEIESMKLEEVESINRAIINIWKDCNHKDELGG